MVVGGVIDKDRLRDILLVFDGFSENFYKALPYPSECGLLRFGAQSLQPLVFRMDFFDRHEIWFEYRRHMGYSSITKMAEVPVPLVSRNMHHGRVNVHCFMLHDRELILLDSVARVIGQAALVGAEKGEIVV
jgi:hypothetical protein